MYRDFATLGRPESKSSFRTGDCCPVGKPKKGCRNESSWEAGQGSFLCRKRGRDYFGRCCMCLSAMRKGGSLPPGCALHPIGLLGLWNSSGEKTTITGAFPIIFQYGRRSSFSREDGSFRAKAIQTPLGFCLARLSCFRRSLYHCSSLPVTVLDDHPEFASIRRRFLCFFG